MELVLSISAAVLLYALLLLATGRTARERDEVHQRISQISQQMTRTYVITDEDLNKPLYERLIRPTLHGIAHFLTKLVPARRRTDRSGDTKLKKQLEQAGWSISAEDFLIIRFTLMVGAAVGALMVGVLLRLSTAVLIFLFVFGAFTVYTIIRYVVTARATARRTAIERQLPDMLDLLSVSVEAGLGFEQALYHITENMDGPLIDEVSVTYREMSMGRSRRDALTLLGERCGVGDVQSFTAALIQAGQLGIPIKNVLRTQAAAIRRSRRNKVQEKAAKVSTKILLPMLLFIFPVLFIVLLGPSILTIMGTFK